MLELHNLTAGYPGNPVLSDLSITFPKNAVTVIAGPNGCGKSTLLKTIAGILPGSGTMLLDGEDLNTLSSRHRAQRVAFLPQNRSVPEITVQRLVLHGRFPYLRYPRQYSTADYAAAKAAMEDLGIADLSHRPLKTLSGGQRQKVYIAMALAQDTEVVLMDEPTSFLDIAHQLQLMALARTLAEKGKTVVLVLHDLPLSFEYAHHLILMDAGGILAAGTPEEVFRSGAVTKAFGVCLDRTLTDRGWKYFH